MLDKLPQQPADPIIELSMRCRSDTSASAMDLSVGVFKDPQGHTPIMQAVRIAEPRRLAMEDTRAYQGITGDQRFNQEVAKLILGKTNPILNEDRVSTLQTIAGSAAILLAGQLIDLAMDEPLVWAGTPTWANHFPLLETAGVNVKEFPYYDRKSNTIQFDAMMSALKSLPKGSVVLLHGCCHNPTGADLSKQQWNEVADLMASSGLIPFIDVAYQGFGAGIEEDAYSWRLLAEKVPEMMISFSCSKSFGLYRDRIGALLVISSDKKSQQRTHSNMMKCIRATYSMPAAHGAFLVAEILCDSELYASWQQELNAMRERINTMRSSFTQAMDTRGYGERFNYIAIQFGMFSYLGISEEQTRQLRDDFSIYMPKSSRISIAGITPSNLDYFADALVSVIAE